MRKARISLSDLEELEVRPQPGSYGPTPRSTLPFLCTRNRTLDWGGGFFTFLEKITESVEMTFQI
jgi:hypothetical protein